MREQYRKTFLAVQALTVLITATVYLKCDHQWRPSLMIFVVMQVGGVFGAMWAARLKRRLQPNGW